MTTKPHKKTKPLTNDESLAMFRCAMYSAMGAVGDERPTDRQCIEWLALVTAQAAYRLSPPMYFSQHEPVSVKLVGVVPEVVIHRVDAYVPLPDWRHLKP